MSATETFQSLDDTMKRVREAYESEVKTIKDQLLAAQIELEMWKTRGREALADRDAHMRVSTKLITQFGLVEKVFSDAKNLALAHFANLEAEMKDEVKTIVEKVEGAL